MDLLGLPAADLARAIRDVAPEPYRASQIQRWIWERRATSFAGMTDLPRGMRAALAERFTIALPEVVSRSPAADGAEKFLFELEGGVRVEAVYMMDSKRRPAAEASESAPGTRITVCLSSQAGCAVDCAFCVTGRLGAGRNLTAGEIVGQYLVLAREKDFGPREANVVFMGMGEPLLNVANVAVALDLLSREVSPRRTTVSTAGIVPGIELLALREHRPNLAVSLCAADDETRSLLMPVNRTWPLAKLFAALKKWPLEKGRRITFEWVLIAGVNDSPEMARRLVSLVRQLPSKVNLIPLNESAKWLPDLKRPSQGVIDAFARALASAKVDVTVRWSKGLQADAACGQLKGREAPARARGPAEPTSGR
ncbi:MAG: 23S rRNA (adenine(2503)-C(2))-methyltransferase RlmN [Thermoanaerobaculia bacterium]